MLAMLIIGIIIGVLGTLAILYFLKKKPEDMPEDLLDYFDFDEELYDELDAIYDEEKN